MLLRVTQIFSTGVVCLESEPICDLVVSLLDLHHVLWGVGMFSVPTASPLHLMPLRNTNFSCFVESLLYWASQVCELSSVLS